MRFLGLRFDDLKVFGLRDFVDEVILWMIRLLSNYFRRFGQICRRPRQSPLSEVRRAGKRNVPKDMQRKALDPAVNRY